MGKAIDHTGIRYGKAVGVRYTGRKHKGKRIWVWQCDCGAYFEAVSSDFVHRDYSPGCPSCAKEAKSRRTVERFTTHGMVHEKPYKSWEAMKNRVINPNGKDYEKYSALGIEEDFLHSFEEFYKDIGEYPSGEARYTIDRIDSTIGYYRGNLRWATRAQQSRNQVKRKTNTTGVTGVQINEKHPGEFSAVAQWIDINGNIHRKSFSFSKYGEEEAFRLACQCRDEQINLLNQLGASYSESHGK